MSPPAPGAEGAPRSPAPPPAPPVPSYVPPSDRFGSFQRQRRPDPVGAADRIASYAFFLWNYDRREDFGEDEISGCFRADGVELPGDASDLYRALVEHRILEPVNGRDGTWRLTSKGRAHVRGHLLTA